MVKKFGTKKQRLSDIPSDKEKPNFEDPLSRKSRRKGLLGIIETAIRSFRGIATFLLLSPIAFIYIVSIALALSPGIYVSLYLYDFALDFMLWQKAIIYGFSVGICIVSYWLFILLIVPIFNLPFIFLLKPSKGTWYSLNVIPWLYHNALVQLVRYTCLDFISPSPLNVLFFRLMGMKIGKGVVINSSNISDPCLIELGDYVTIGGSATIFAHYGMKGFLIVKNTKIMKGSTIGLKASIMGDVIIGEGMMIPPHTVVLPKSRIFDIKDLNKK